MAEKNLSGMAHIFQLKTWANTNYYRDIIWFSEEWTAGSKDGGISRDEMRLLFAEDRSL
jgi:hypothetical protein